MNSKIRLLLDLGPLGAFFIAYKLGGLLVATEVIIVLTVFSLIYTYIKEKRIAPMPLISGALITVLGGLTLYLNDPVFVKIKPTVVNLVFAALLIGGWMRGKPVLKYLLDHALSLDEPGWLKLSLRWGLFFVFLAGLNEVIWRQFSEEFWVNFKVFGMFTLTTAFTLCQLPLMKQHWLEEEDAA